MNDDQLNKLFAAARQAPPATDRVELGFETRLLARLRSERATAAPWFAWAWRLAPVFVLVVLALGVWEWTTPRNGTTEDDTILVALLGGEE